MIVGANLNEHPVEEAAVDQLYTCTVATVDVAAGLCVFTRKQDKDVMLLVFFGWKPWPATDFQWIQSFPSVKLQQSCQFFLGFFLLDNHS